MASPDTSLDPKPGDLVIDEVQKDGSWVKRAFRRTANRVIGWNASSVPGSQMLAASGGDGTLTFPAITELTGGAPAGVDGLGVVADELQEQRLIWLPNMAGGSPKLWHLVAGTDAQDLESFIVRPADYHASTNAFVLKGFL